MRCEPVKILVLHRFPDTLVGYRALIDHDIDDVTYLSAPSRRASLPSGVRAQILERQDSSGNPEDDADQILRLLSGKPRPDRVVALSEYDLMTAALLRQAWHIPGPTPDQTRLVTDKIAMKAAVSAAGIRRPGYLATPFMEEPSWHGPTVLKPRSGASSSGVRVFDTPQAAMKQAQPDEEIEEWVAGDILHIDGVIAPGLGLIGLQASRYLGTCLAYVSGEPLGSVQVDGPSDLAEWTSRCLAAVGLESGPFHLEAIESPHGLTFLEIGARVGGADVTTAHRLTTGVDLAASHVNLLLDRPPVLDRNHVPAQGARHGWFIMPGHHLASTHCLVTGSDLIRRDPLVYRWSERGPEEPVSQVVTYADTDVAVAGVLGPGTSTDLDRVLREIFAQVRVQPRTEDTP